VHIETVPEGEREEVRQIFAAKGFEGDDLERAVFIITSERERWIDTMIVEEHGISLEGPSATRAAATTFVAFLLVGIVPLLSFLCELAFPGFPPSPFFVSIGLTAISFFGVGALKSMFVDQTWCVKSHKEWIVLHVRHWLCPLQTFHCCE